MAAGIGPGPGVIGQILYSLGYVPKVSASVQSLKNQLNQIGQQITSLQAQDATVQQAITSAKAAITGLTAHFQALTDEITADVNDISALSASIADLKSQLASDSTTITSLTGELSGAVASLNGLTQLNASPSWVSQGNGLASEDVTGGTIDFDGVTQTVTQGLDGGISAFIDPGAVEAVFSFSPGFSGLSAPSSSPATQAQGLGGIGGNLATLLGYIPISQATSDAPQVAELKSLIITATAQLQNVQTLLANDQSTLSGLTTQKNSLQGQVNSAQLNFSSYQSHIASLNATIASDTSQHGSNLSTISGLTTNLDSVNSVLSHAQVGNTASFSVVDVR